MQKTLLITAKILINKAHILLDMVQILLKLAHMVQMLFIMAQMLLNTVHTFLRCPFQCTYVTVYTSYLTNTPHEKYHTLSNYLIAKFICYLTCIIHYWPTKFIHFRSSSTNTHILLTICHTLLTIVHSLLSISHTLLYHRILIHYWLQFILYQPQPK